MGVLVSTVVFVYLAETISSTCAGPEVPSFQGYLYDKLNNYCALVKEVPIKCLP